MDKADLAWVGISTVLVLFMVMPGLALFYGGLVRAKNVLSILVQVTSVFALALVVWFVYGYSLAFTESGAVLGGLSRVFSGMMDLGTGKHQLSGTIPEFIFATFQATFAGITCALIWAGFAQRVRYSAVLVSPGMDHTGLYPDRPHGMGPQGFPAYPRRARFRRRHRGAYQLRGRRPDLRLLCRKAHRPRPRSHASAQLAHGHDRCIAAVGRLVRLQCRLRAVGK